MWQFLLENPSNITTAPFFYPGFNVVISTTMFLCNFIIFHLIIGSVSLNSANTTENYLKFNDLAKKPKMHKLTTKKRK